MNDEIIELLLYKLEQNYKCEKENYFILYKPDIKDLLDYITNLKQDIANYVDVVLHDRIIIGNLQQRIDKAIELLNKRKEEYEDLPWVEMRTELYYEECDELINILKGDDENEK